MAHLHFRMTKIELDEEEDVKAVTAVVDAPAMDLLAQWLGWDSSPAGPEVTLGLQAAQQAFAASGKVRGDDPVYPSSHDIYESLGAVFYGYMGIE